MKAKGKAPKDDKWKAKYEEPAPVDSEGLPELPPTWAWAPLELLTTRITDGVHKKPTYVDRGVPFVTVKNLTAGPDISFEDLNYISESDHREFTARTKPEQGDILISKDGTLGVVRQIRTTREFSIFVSVALLKILDRSMSNFIEWALKSPVVQRQLVPTGTGLLHLHLQDLRKDCVPVAPPEEQAEVNRQLGEIGDAGFSALSDSPVAGIEALQKFERSLLAKAFRGELTT
jgi:type I restriction enzyme S subunit